jgi:hypothetical protein
MDRRPPWWTHHIWSAHEAVDHDEYGRLTLLPSDGEWVEAVGVGVLTKTSAALWSVGCPRPEGRRRGVRLDVRVAVRLGAETLLASGGQDVSESGRECLVNDAWEIFETEPRELGSALAEVHLRLCQVHDPVPLKLAARLAKLVGDADGETYLDVPEGSTDVLGVEGLAEFEALLDGASR